MASDNEDDDLDALREAALATLKQKVQPIENVFRGSNTARQDSAAWSDVPASIDFPGFSDPIPEQNHFPPPFEEPAIRPPAPQHLFRPATNLPWNPSHQNRIPPFQSQRMRHPRFPHRTFGDMGGPHDRGNRRLRPRGYLPSQPGRGGGFPPGNHPHHATGDMALPLQPLNGPPSAMGANLIVIQPLMPSGDRVDPSSSSSAQSVPVNNNSSGSSRGRSSHVHSDNSQARPKLELPQDKYHSSGDSKPVVKEPEPKVKSKDKFSRYEKSDSEEDEDDDDDLSEVDDIANEIDKVLQDDFLAEEIVVQEAEEDDAADEKTESTTEKEEEDTKESDPSSPVPSEKQDTDNNDEVNESKTPAAALSDISDSESLDLDALAGGDPVVGDFDDLDALVDKEPDSVAGDSDSQHVIKKGSTNSNDSDRNSELRGSVKKDSEIRESSKENTASSNRLSPSRRRSSLSPHSHRKTSPPPRYTNAISPTRKYDSYNNRTYPSQNRARSPLYSRHFRSRSRSPFHRKSPTRRSSISPRRRPGSPSNRRYKSSQRQYPVDRVRRRSLSPSRRAVSPSARDRYRPGREDASRYRSNHTSRPVESRHRESDRYHRDRDRPRPAERDRIENKREPEAKIADTDKKVSPLTLTNRISPLMERNKSSQEKEKANIDLEKLTPEERAKIEARRKKFDNRAVVNVAEASKKISLKDIKKREKKSKIKEEEKTKEDETLKLEESLPDVVNKKSSSKSGISLKKLRKKQESKKRKDEEDEAEQESPKAVGLADLEDESENESDEDRSWRKESAGASGKAIKFGVSRTMVNKAPLVSLDSIGRMGGSRRHQDSNRRRFPEHQERRGHSERLNVGKSRRMQNNRWSSDEDSDTGGIQANRLSSSVVTSKSKPFEADIAPEKLRIQVQIAPKDSKKKSKAVPDFSNVYSVHAKRRRDADTTNSNDEEKEEEEEIVVPAKKSKKKKEKKKKHSKEDNLEEMELPDSTSKSPAKPSVLERLGKKVSLDSLEKKGKKKKKSKKSRDIDEDTDDLDLHILKMKAKNEEILRRQREIELDKERYG